MISTSKYQLQIVNEHGAPVPYLGDGLFQMEHGQKYGIYLSSLVSVQTEVTIKIDDTVVGTWAFPAYDTDTLFRPAEVNQAFKFLLSDSEEGHQANISSLEQSKKGLITVTCKPEVKVKKKKEVTYTPVVLNDDNQSRGGSFSSGGTALGGETTQEFETVEQFATPKNKSDWTIMYARLVGKKPAEAITPLSALNKPETTQFPPTVA